MRPELPTGTVTFVFTDVEGSTSLLNELGPEAYASALADHRSAIRHACSEYDGVEVDTQGDAFFFAFPTASGALAAATTLTDVLATGPIQVRVGLHTGTPLLTAEGYVGSDVHRAVRIAAAGHGGQVLVSSSTSALLDVELRDLGEHRLKDLAAPERIYQLGDEEFASLRSLYSTNLPVPGTSFLGRDRELSDVVELLGDDEARVLTLVGPAGTGKTRLALRAAAEASEDFPDGVWWIPLAPVRSHELIVSVLAQTLEIREKPGRKLEETLSSELAGRRALLLLDNLEHLLPGAAETVALLRDTRGPRVLVTSRERLRIRGERSYPVPPLSSHDGVALFVARSRAVDPGFTHTAAVDELCDRLDELPLAIELAAARTALFTPEQLLERVSDRLDLLTGDRDADPRQQTLRATIDWSFELLTDEERQLFRQLGVFLGGCTYEAAEEVCGATPDTLQSLIDKSLLRRRDDPGARRYWMLETIRQYALERLEEADETSSLRDRHAAYYASMSAAWAGPVREDPRDPRRTGVVERERANIHAAAEWSLAQNGVSVVHAGLATAWRLLWVLDGYAGRFSDAASEAEHAIAHARLGGDVAQLRRSAIGFGSAVVFGPTPVVDGIASCERTFELIRGDAISEGALLNFLACLWALKEEFDRARELLGQGRALLAEVDEVESAWGANQVAFAERVRVGARVDAWRVLTLEGDLDAAERELREAHEQLLRMDQRDLRSTVCGLLGQTLYALGRYDEIGQFVLLAEELAPGDDYNTEALWRAVRAKMLARQGSFEEAEALARRAVEILAATDGLLWQFSSLLDLAEVQRLAGSDAIGNTLAEARELAEAKGSPVLTRWVVDRCAAVDAAT